MNRHEVQKARKIPRLIYGLFGAGIVLLFVGWLFFGTHPSSSAKQRLSSSATPTSSANPNPTSAPSRMIVGEPIKARLSSQDNAANDWRKAFALADKLTDREKNLLKIKSLPDPAPTDDEIAALLEKIDPIIMLLRAGAAKPGCDWGLPQFLSFSTNMPHINQASLLARIALWDSFQRVGTEPREAAENIMAMSDLGNSLQATTISGALNTYIHDWIYGFLSAHADSFSGPDQERMQAIIDGPEFAQSLQASFSTELEMIKDNIRAFETGEKSDGSPLTGKEKRDLHIVLGSPPSEIQALGHLLEIEEIWQPSIYWPDDKFQNWLADYRKRISNPALLEAANDSIRTRDIYRKALTDQQLVKAGWTVMEEGQTAVARLRDPLTGKPFRYRQIDEQGSFELQSEVLQNGKPVTMTFPRSGR